MADRPETKGLRPYGGNGKVDVVLSADANPMSKAMKCPQFWLLAFSFGICGLTTSGLFQTHLISHGVEHGFSKMTMAGSGFPGADGGYRHSSHHPVRLAVRPLR